MSDYRFKVDFVWSNKKPTPKVGGTTYSTTEITLPKLREIAVLLSDTVFSETLPKKRPERDQRCAEIAKEIVGGLVYSFVPLDSRPSGPIWIPSGPKAYFHPSDKPGSVLVGQFSASSYWQLSISVESR